MSKVVKSGVIEVSYDINDYTVDDEVQYDWTTANGDSSDELFDSIEDAERDLRRRY